jgi:hypothetical protein
MNISRPLVVLGAYSPTLVRAALRRLWPKVRRPRVVRRTFCPFAWICAVVLLLGLVACSSKHTARAASPAANANQPAGQAADAQPGLQAPSDQEAGLASPSQSQNDHAVNAGNTSNDTAKQPEEANDESRPRPDLDEAHLKAFIAALKKAVTADNRRKVASMIRYPIVILAGGRNVLFRGPSSLVASYDLVFTPRRKKSIAKARAGDLFSNWQGAMIGRGDIWIDTVDSGAVKIITINDEPGAKAPKPLAPDLKLHPKVFSLIDYPRVKEINLDDINLDDNRFQEEDVKVKDVKLKNGWTWCDVEYGQLWGFMCYRVLEARGNHYTVEYEDNGGGRITESAIIEFVVETRQVHTDGKLKSIRVLRVLAYTAT